ncbi:MAG: hypothetical protein CSA65_00085 [Proteobacteria bacterium]|nr:MAG: hypothetical protein CSA65_00085 [Pseudomonadota bacterium]
MATKQVIDRQKSANSVVQIGTTQLGLLLPELAKELGLSDEGPVGILLETSLKRLAKVRDELVAADDALSAEDSQDTGARAARERAMEAAFERIVQVRGAIQNAFGDAIPEPVFGAGSTPTDPNRLLAYGRNATAQLGKVAFPAPLEGLSIDPAALASGLTAKLDALATALNAMAAEERETQLARQQRHQALEVFDRVFTAVARQFEGYFKLTGHDELADRVRPSTRRPGTTVSPPTPE